MTIQISAIICTHNRAALLPESVRSVFAQTLESADYELIVVDNASQDATPQVVAGLIAAKPATLQVIDLRERNLGLACARNAGLSAARGEFVAYLDDDAVADPDWLRATIEAFASSEAIACVGGPVQPLWPASPPTWMDEFLQSYLSVLNLGETKRAVDPSREWLAGANIAFRRASLLEIGGFAKHLGRQGVNLMSNEDTDAVMRLAQRGHQIWYTPFASVQHHIHAQRMSRYWILNRAFWQGVSNVLMTRAGEFGEVPGLEQRRINALLVRSLGKEYLKDYLRHDVLGRHSRMRWLARRAKNLGTAFAESLLNEPGPQRSG